jgi:hypothetical protein
MCIGGVIIRSSSLGSILSSVDRLDQLAALLTLDIYPTLCTASMRNGYALVRLLPFLIHFH